MEEPEAFFILKAEERHPVALLCVTMCDSIMSDQPRVKLTEQHMEAYETLKTKLMLAEDDQDTDVALEHLETFCLQHAYVQTAYAVKGHLLLDDSQKKTTEADEEIEGVFELLKEYAPTLLWRLTQTLGYSDYGLDTLEKVFDIKTDVVHLLPVDNVKEEAGITITEQNEHALHFNFSLLNYVRHLGEESTFAKRFAEHQYMHLQDFDVVTQKILAAKVGERVQLTQLDNIILYWITALTQRMFTSDAADIIESIAKSIDYDSYKKMRSFLIQYDTVLLKEMNELLAHDKLVLSYFKKVDDWVI